MANAYKVLGQVAPSATTDTTLYTVPAATETVISTIVIANRVASVATFDIAIRPNGEALVTKHYIAKSVTVGASDSTTMTLGITLDAADVVTIQASTANLSFNIFGSEITA
jgi:hypothetical protein